MPYDVTNVLVSALTIRGLSADVFRLILSERASDRGIAGVRPVSRRLGKCVDLQE